ncbi:hypothetical protein DQ04_20071000 [Trypanosoma grayi]|uniref:hypothetical protein n=1 Tax=Trypanosoma grayi TaxID=71804 RepID=UPI0004F46EE4|nr:hypothetical protein DQ04_20071000 [Trypanosoma grayi]KEG05607.1 hypothetical protein DQ04_20071000 [Trypanosoma grayi]
MNNSPHAIRDCQFSDTATAIWSDPYVTGRRWLARRPTRSEHPFHRDSISIGTSTNSAASELACQGILAPSPVRPRVRMASFPQYARQPPIGSDGSGSWGHSTDVAASATPAQTSSVTLEAEVVKASMKTQAETQLFLRCSPHIMIHSTTKVPAAGHLHPSGGNCPTTPNSAGVRIRSGTIDDDDAVRTYFFVNVPELWGEGFGQSDFVAGVIRKELVINVGAAKTFQRSGARRCRAAGPGFEQADLQTFWRAAATCDGDAERSGLGEDEIK